MRRLRILGCALTILAGASCAPHANVASAEASLLATDRAWAHDVAAGVPVDSLVSYWTDDARVVMAGDRTNRGRTAILRMVQDMLAVPGFRLSWTPDSAVVAASGDLGYTYGTNAVTFPDSTGKLSTTPGRYITVWRRNAEGRWQCVMDYSTPGPDA